MLVKVLQFKVSNFFSLYPEKEFGENEKFTKFDTPKDIEKKVNDVIEDLWDDYELVDIIVTNIPAQFHNNGYGNVNILNYTLTFKGRDWSL